MLVAVAAGVLLGLALGTVGGGGAVLAVPVLVYLLGQTVHAATTTSLVVVAAAAGSGAVGHARRGAVCWRLAAAFAVAAVPGSIAGTLANRAAGATALLAAFAVLLLVVSVVTWRRGAAREVPGGGDCPRARPLAVIAAGLGIGALTGLLGVGGGFAVVPALALGLAVPLRRAIATSLVIVTAVSVAGLAEHLAAGGDVDWTIAVPFALAAMLAAALGAPLAARLQARTLARGFAVVLGAVGVYMLTAVAFLGGTPQG